MTIDSRRNLPLLSRAQGSICIKRLDLDFSTARTRGGREPPWQGVSRLGHHRRYHHHPRLTLLAEGREQFSWQMQLDLVDGWLR